MAIIELVQEKTVTAEAEAARKTKFAKDEKKSAPKPRPSRRGRGPSPRTPRPTSRSRRATSDDEHPYGAGSHAAPEDGSQPAGFPIKGNADSMLYHTPDSEYYDRTVAEVWFKTEEDAERPASRSRRPQEDES